MELNLGNVIAAFKKVETNAYDSIDNIYNYTKLDKDLVASVFGLTYKTLKEHLIKKIDIDYKSDIEREEARNSFFEIEQNFNIKYQKALVSSNIITAQTKEAILKEMGVIGDGNNKKLNIVYINYSKQQLQYEAEISALKTQIRILQDKLEDYLKKFGDL